MKIFYLRIFRCEIFNFSFVLAFFFSSSSNALRICDLYFFRVGRFRYILGILKFEKDLEEILSMLRVNLVNSRRIFREKGLIIASFVIVASSHQGSRLAPHVVSVRHRILNEANCNADEAR